MKSIFSSRAQRRHQPAPEQAEREPFFSKAVQGETAPAKTAFFQPKLAIGAPNDPFEREADAMADKVVNHQHGGRQAANGGQPAVQTKEISSVQRLATPEEEKMPSTNDQRMREDKLIQEKPMDGGRIQKMDAPKPEEEEKKPAVQRMEAPKPQEEDKIPGVQKMDAPEKEKEKAGAAPVQAKAEGGGSVASPQLTSRIEGSKRRGRPLPNNTRAEMESSFGADFSGVNIHTDTEAAEMNKGLRAHAFTHGSDIYFNTGKFNPGSTEGKRLLAHELTHTFQQGAVRAKTDKSPAVQRNMIQKDDASFESGSGVGTAVAAGTMTADAIAGQTYTAENCRGLFGCNVGFNFEKAYKGTYPYRAAARDVKGVYVKIKSVYDHNICGTCDSLKFIQVFRNVKKNTANVIETADPGTDKRRERAGWGNAASGSRGWGVDRIESATNPFYGINNFSVQTGTAADPAYLWDAPGDWATDKNVGSEFQTFLVCETAGGSKRITLAGINWGYYIDSSGNISFLPATPVATCGASQELKDSATRWEGIAGNLKTGIDFSGESPVAHDSDRPRLWFGLDSTALRNDASAPSDANYALALRYIRQHIMATSPLTRIIIHGYASRDGKAKYNMGLSLRRAEAIRARLIADGIPAHMLEVKAHGEDATLSPQDMNRRAEIQMTRWTFGDILQGLKNLFFGKKKAK